MKLATLIDDLILTREQRLMAQRTVDGMKEQEDALKADVVKELHKQKLDGAKGGNGMVSFKRLNVPQLVDEAKFLKWALKDENRDCMKVAVFAEGWRARLTAGVKVPGVDTFIKEDLTVTPAK